jgi:hypothetical protein
MSKYAEDIAEIKTDMKHVLKHCEKMNTSQAKQWDKINENEGNIKVLNSRLNTWAGIQAALSAGLAAAAAWFGKR